MSEFNDATNSRARVIGNAVFLEHIGMDGDIATWQMGSHTSAQFVADRINELLNDMRHSLAESARLAGEYAHWARNTIEDLERKVKKQDFDFQ